MSVLITGASGKLGKEITQCLAFYNLDYIAYSHSMPLNDLDWSSIDTIVNCAAVLPSENVTREEYLSGNVIFLQSLLKYSKDKTFIHFATFSELYKNDFYQLSKMIANSLLLANSSLFTRLEIFHLPTLEDENLIQSIVDQASAGLIPKVDHLKYNYMSFECVASFIKENIFNLSKNHISDFYIRKDLYEEVTKRVDSTLILEGIEVDRTLFDSSVYHTMPEMLELLVK